MASSIGGLIVLFLLYASGAIFATVMLAVGIACGIRWGITWSFKEIARDAEIEAWLKRIFNPAEK